MKGKREILGALDLGSSEIVIVIAEVTSEGVTVLGVGTAPCEGLDAGRVVSINETVKAIARAKADAEQMSGCELGDVLVCVSGTHIYSMNNRGSYYHQKCTEVTRGDVASVLQNAMAVRIPDDCMIVSVVPRQYILDKHEGIRDPIGMSGIQLEADVHMIIASKAAVDNIRRCVEGASLRVRDFVAAPLATALAVLEDEEKEMGVVMLDMGGGTTDVQIWIDGRPEWTGVIDVGGDLITTAISRSLRTPVACAEDTKIRFGSAWQSTYDASENLKVVTVGGRGACEISRRTLVEDIIQPTVVEMFTHIGEKLSRTVDLQKLAAGMVISGGSARLSGITEIADEILGIPVRIGNPCNIKGLKSIMDSNPGLSAAWGTALYGAMTIQDEGASPMCPRSAGSQPGSGLSGLLKRVVNYLF